MAMAAAVQVMQSSASLSRQQAPSTAPVLEFACLFTRDLRRKQKRWQDGRLKYHTFNKRIMVYDDHGNFVGDAHWREDYDLNDGDEVELERGGVIVQVSECTGSRDQDLSELVDKRAQEKAERHAAALARRPPALDSAPTFQAVAPHFQLRHKPLHHLIGTPTGHHGRALMPTESPYEERQKMSVPPQDSTTRPAKRRKREVSPPSKGGYAQSLFGAALTLSGTPTSTPSIRSRPPKASPDPDHHDEDEDSAPILTRPIAMATTISKEMLDRAPRTILLNKISRVPEALVQDMNEIQFPSLPIESGTVPDEQHNLTGSTRRLGLERNGKARRRVVEDDSLHPTSVNSNATDLNPDKSNPTRLKGKCDVLDDVPSATSSGSKKPKHPSLVPKSKTSVRSQGLSAVSSLRNMPNPTGPNQESWGSDHKQTISEPRTELRIKPRKKRGLLMISENLETCNSSSLRVAKNRIDRQDPSTLLVDKATRHLNNNVSDRNGSLGIESSEDNHSRRKKENTINSTKGINKRSSGPAKTDLHDRQNTANHEGHLAKQLDTSHFLRRAGSSDEEPFSTHSVSSTKPKSRERQNREMRRDKQYSPTDEESEDVPDISSPVIQDECGRLEKVSHSHHDKISDRRTTMLESAHEDADLTSTAGSPKRRRQSSRKKKKAPTEDDIDPSMTKRCDDKKDEEDFLFGNVPAPRLAHLGRKSIRSREVIGFIFDDEDIIDCGGLPQSGDGGKCGKESLAHHLSADHLGEQATKFEANRTNMITTDGNRINANDHCQDYSPIKEIKVAEDCTIPRSTDRRNTDTADVEATSKFLREKAKSGVAQTDASLDMQAPVLENAAAVSQPSSRIVVNPATRGKKAAKPSDAAGQVPQCPLPSEAVAGNPSISGKHEDDRRRSRVENRVKEATITPMPGFARANGGPWSREAHDLFEFTRPP
ncbi:uncharacterized protein F4807DRAFT_414615 [Annulohypoxylon truncatum]|uniref:uncharacterized protein n=1 Tax=Annulohypoxylon truncatum TaxID=327061 RepID=UPI002007B4B0|nr:uncharacterized protein F4807DRAFT_414615 [Annulohypoxylon truncatum]KAI1212809.1 hypothetical protein F4807DRAFT_414615 [Annulohypoxylon truncatum]